MEQNENPYAKLWEVARRYLSLNFENFKLAATEKTTLMVSAMLLTLACLLLGVILLFFVSLGVVQFLAPVFGLACSYLIMAAFVAIVGIAIFLLRKPLIYNPVARFISRVLLK